MTRRAIIVVLALAAAGTAGVCASHTTGVIWRSSDLPPKKGDLPHLSFEIGHACLDVLWIEDAPNVDAPYRAYMAALGAALDAYDAQKLEELRAADPPVPASEWPAEEIRFGRLKWRTWYTRLSSGTSRVCNAVLPLWVLVIIFAAYPAFSVLLHPPLRRRRRRHLGLCVKCGYDLTGNVTGVCSECGGQYESKTA